MVGLAVAVRRGARTRRGPGSACTGGRPGPSPKTIRSWSSGGAIVEDPLGPVADLALAAQVDLGGDRSDQRAARARRRRWRTPSRPRPGGWATARSSRATPSISAGPASSWWMLVDLVEAPPGVPRRDQRRCRRLRAGARRRTGASSRAAGSGGRTGRTRRAPSTGRPGHRGARRRRARSQISPSADDRLRRRRDRTARRRSRAAGTQPVAAASAGRRTTGSSPAASGGARRWPAGRRSAAADDRRAGPPDPPVRGSRAGGGQLDGQRDAVEATADLLDVVPVGVRSRTSGEAADARSLNSSTPGPVGFQGRDDDELLVADARGRSREVASTRTFGQPSATAAASSAAPSMTCSQLSSTSSARR